MALPGTDIDRPSAGPDKGRRRRRRLLLAWVLTVHLVAIVAMVWPGGVERLHAWVRGTPAAYGSYRGMIEAHQVALRCTEGRPVLFLGDSLIEGLHVESTCGGRVLNFGIGGDTTAGLLWRLLGPSAWP
jgi:hypothetical protein